ncbi:MAG: hypothetical protein RPR28_06505 [Cycloclasticus sp.]
MNNRMIDKGCSVRGLFLICVFVLLSSCSLISVVDTAVDVVLLPVKVGVATVEAVIPDDD